AERLRLTVRINRVHRHRLAADMHVRLVADDARRLLELRERFVWQTSYYMAPPCFSCEETAHEARACRACPGRHSPSLGGAAFLPVCFRPGAVGAGPADRRRRYPARRQGSGVAQRPAQADEEAR